MVKDQGVIVEVHGPMARVRVKRTDACESCGNSAVCNTFGVSKDIEAEAVNTAGARVNDLVILEMRSGSLLKISFIVYMIPALAIVIGAVLGLEFGKSRGYNPETTAIIIGLIFFGLSIMAIKIFSGFLKNDSKFLPEVTKVISSDVDITGQTCSPSDGG